MKVKKFENLTKSEIKRVIRYAMNRDGVEACVSAWWTEPQTENDEFTGFLTVGCEVLTADYSERLDNVYICVCLWDRRHSFVAKGCEHWAHGYIEAQESAQETAEAAQETIINNEEENTMINAEAYGAMFKEDRDAARETVKAWRDAVKTLDRIQSDDCINEETPAHTVEKFVEEVGEDLARFVIASLVNRSAWDGRIYDSVAEWAQNAKSALTEDGALEAGIYTTMHMAHLNQIAQAMAKYEPKASDEECDEIVADEEIVEEETETVEGLTYEEFQKLAMQNYTRGGDVVVECWERQEFDEYVKLFGAIDEKKAFQIFDMYRSTEEEEESMARWMSGEGNNDETEHDDAETEEEEEAEPNAEQIIDEVEKKIEAIKTRSAWDRGVKDYAEELLFSLRENAEGGYIDAGDLCNRKLFEKAMLNGASDWAQFSEGGCSLCYDGQIAERLCAPWELKKTQRGAKDPNPRERWIDVQSRALYQAAQMILRAAF